MREAGQNVRLLVTWPQRCCEQQPCTAQVKSQGDEADGTLTIDEHPGAPHYEDEGK